MVSKKLFILTAHKKNTMAAADTRKQDGIQYTHINKICRTERSVFLESISAVLKHEYKVINKLSRE